MGLDAAIIIAIGMYTQREMTMISTTLVVTVCPARNYVQIHRNAVE